MPSDNEQKSVPRFSGIADPKCKCTPDNLCRRCAGGKGSDLQITGKHFAGKFRVPFEEAVRENNRKYIEEKGGNP